MVDLALRDGSFAAVTSHWLVRGLLALFVVISVFDPANLVTGAKLEAFLALWLATLVALAAGSADARPPAGLLVYVLAFCAVPLASILWYYAIDGREPFAGGQLFKGYLLISLAIVLVINRIDLVPQLCTILTGLAALVIMVFIYLEVRPGEYLHVREIGIQTGLLSLDTRRFGHWELLQVYFVTSPMLVFAAANYVDRTTTAARRRLRWHYAALAGFNIVGLLLAGTRNNMLAAVLLPFLLWPLYARKPARAALISAALLVLCALPFIHQLPAFFDPHETGNSIKLNLLADYGRILSDPLTLLFGRELGAYEFWSARGRDFYISELTYLEMIRNFGVFGATVMALLLLIPVVLAFRSGSVRDRALATAYALYLVMCATNPNLFSSMGVLILAALVANLAMERTGVSGTALNLPWSSAKGSTTPADHASVPDDDEYQ